MTAGHSIEGFIGCQSVQTLDTSPATSALTCRLMLQRRLGSERLRRQIDKFSALQSAARIDGLQLRL